jgi:signal peptidase I
LKDLAPLDAASHAFAREKLPGCTHLVADWPGVPARRDFGPLQVPEGKFFMMGDNRDDSFDSRYFGPVDRRQILGRATAVVMSLDKQNLWFPRWDRFFSSLTK